MKFSRTKDDVLVTRKIEKKARQMSSKRLCIHNFVPPQSHTTTLKMEKSIVKRDMNGKNHDKKCLIKFGVNKV